MSKYSDTCFYHEYYTSHRGDWHEKKTFDIGVMDELRDRFVDGYEHDDLEDVYDDLEVLTEVLHEWPVIRKALEKDGYFADIWEEGSFAISMTSAAEAKNLIRDLEAKLFAESFL